MSALAFHFPAGRNQDASLTQLRHIKGLFFHSGADSSAVSSKSTSESANHSWACAETMVPNKRITWREETVVQSGTLMKRRRRLSQSGPPGARVALQLFPRKPLKLQGSKCWFSVNRLWSALNIRDAGRELTGLVSSFFCSKHHLDFMNTVFYHSLPEPITRQQHLPLCVPVPWHGLPWCFRSLMLTAATPWWSLVLPRWYSCRFCATFSNQAHPYFSSYITGQKGMWYRDMKGRKTMKGKPVFHLYFKVVTFGHKIGK